MSEVPSLVGSAARRLLYLLLPGVLAWLLTAIVFVDETEFVIVERLGRIVAVYDRPDDRGWQWKAPWPIDTVRRFDRRLRVLVPAGREVFTRDRKNLVVEASVCWRIAGTTEGSTDLLTRPVVRFYRSLGVPSVAETRLASRLQALLTTQLGRITLAELLSAESSEAGPSRDAGPLAHLSDEVQRLLVRQPDEAESWTERLGLEIVDVRLHRLHLPSGNLQAVYERMRSERQKIAERYRSAGLAESTSIRSQAERRAGEILARAKAEAEKIKAAGEAEALSVLNAAYARDPEFAQRLQTLDAYRSLINERTTLILSADSPLWRLLTTGGVSEPPSAVPREELLADPPEEPPLSALGPANGTRRNGAAP
jgi:membrane protease subunit HflC